MKKAFLLIAAVAVGAGAWLHLKKNGSEKERRLRWIEARQGPIEDAIEATGSVTAFNRIEIRAPIGGRVDELLVEEGDAVKAGQIVAWMSSNDRAAILDAARARGPEELKKWQDAYKATPIVAPLSGVVIVRNVVIGETVGSGTVFFAVADELIVLAQVDESDIGRVKSGMPARIVLDAYPDQPVGGKVFDILYEGKNVQNVITYGVKVRPARVPSFFRSQMTANIAFVVGRKENAVVVPASAVQNGQGGSRQVLVEGPEGKPVARLVSIGLELGDRVEILSGVSPGEKVLLARGRYVPQEGPQSSPLGFGGRPQSQGQGQAPAQGEGGRRRRRG